MRTALDGGEPYVPAGRTSEAPLPDGTALVVRTSGSTASPREVALSAAALRASAAATHERLGGPGRWFLALPATHVAGLQVVSRAILAGADVGGGAAGPFTPEGFAAEAGAFLSAGLSAGPAASRSAGSSAELVAAPWAGPVAGPAARSSAGSASPASAASSSARDLPAYVSLVPTQAHRLVEAAAAGAPAGLRTLARFDAVLLGGAATPLRLLTRLREAGVRAVTTYGMSETSGGCVYDGVPLPGVRLRLTDPFPSRGSDSGPVAQAEIADESVHSRENRLPAAARAQGAGGGAGVVEISGSVLASGYVGDDGATAASFRVDGDGTRWFRTSDLGRFDAGGRLEILGRADDVIVTGGVNVAPAAVEAALAELGEVCVVGLPDDEWGQAVVAVLVSPDAGAQPTPAPPGLLDRARTLAADTLGRTSAPRMLYVIGSLPLLGPGKPDRQALTTSLKNLPA
ncbi:hypothetical protein GCM10009751_02340 [Myceligenerans crystallogenes]|uniref:O-succinylbenzoic acid--CoA ligase n=1 Tax=Myceligenerans crystallogenes TaxID=316335 RepID=A0ABN2N3K9_9MICO